MTESSQTTGRPIQTLRRRLETIRRRQRTSRHQAHEFAARRVEARLVLRKARRDDD